MQIELYKFSKRINSTKRPVAGSGLTTQCTIKQNAPYVGTFGSSSDTTVCYPVLFLTNVDNPNAYNYCKAFGDRYYFIRDIQVDINGAATLHCEIDVLATRRTEILASSQYVMYSASDYDLQINDPRHPFYQDANSTSATASLGVDKVTNLIITAIAQGEDLPVVYWLDHLNSSRIADWFTDPDNENIWDTMRNYLGAPINAIFSVRACPVDIMYAAQDIPIVLGHVTITGCFGKRVPYNSIITLPRIHVDLGISGQYSKLDYTFSSQCSRYYIELPFCGIYELPADAIYYYAKDDADVSFSIDYHISPASGDIVGFVYLGTSTRKILSFSGNCYYDVPWGANGSVDVAVLKGMAQAIGTTMSFGLTGMTYSGVQSNGAAFIKSSLTKGPVPDLYRTGTIQNRMSLNVDPGAMGNALMSGMTDARPQTLTGSANTHGLLGYITNSFDEVKIRREFKDPIGTLDSQRTLLGLPLNQMRTLSSLSGFCQCKNPSIEINDLKIIAELINGYLSGGFFIE